MLVGGKPPQPSKASCVCNREFPKNPDLSPSQNPGLGNPGDLRTNEDPLSIPLMVLEKKALKSFDSSTTLKRKKEISSGNEDTGSRSPQNDLGYFVLRSGCWACSSVTSDLHIDNISLTLPQVRFQRSFPTRFSEQKHPSFEPPFREPRSTLFGQGAPVEDIFLHLGVNGKAPTGTPSPTKRGKISERPVSRA